MPTVKTTISLDRVLLDRIDAEARQLKQPRSRVLVMAAEEFLWRRESRKVIDRLNRTYSSESDASPSKHKDHFGEENW